MHYVNYQRTSSKARVGNCLFIKENYFDEMDGWQNLDIPFKKLKEADIVSIRSYQSLIASSIIGELDIDPYSILLINDQSGEYTMDCNVVKPYPGKTGKDAELRVVREPYTQKTDLWDGQSLLDSSVFKNGKYVNKDKEGEIVEHSYEPHGFMLLRNHFFKTAAFNTNLQDYYKERFKGVENPILPDMFGNKFRAEDIKMVTTPNSVKIFKFSDIVCEYMIADDKKSKLNELEALVFEKQEELRKARQAVTTAKRRLTMLLNYDPEKGKEPPTKEDVVMAQDNLDETERYYNENCGRLEDEIKSLLKPVKKEMDRLTWDWYREKIKAQKFGVCKTEKRSKLGDKQQLWYQIFVSLNFGRDELWELVKPQVEEINLMKRYVAWFKRSIDMKAQEKVGDSMMLALLNCNEDVSRTKWYTNYRHSKIQKMIKKLLAGKIQIKGSDFNVLFGNPYEMLRASCGDKIDTSIINDFECYCSRYDDGEELYGMRSPHICTGNNGLLKNAYRDEWNRWFNLTDNIVVVNFWDKGAFLAPKWNGCDVDSDTAFIGNNPIILEKVRQVQKDYLIPINCVPQETKYYEFTNEKMAKVDGQLCNDMVGRVCNLARDLHSLYWHLYNTGTEENKQEYLPMIYDDISMLEVLSNIAIDSAKRTYSCNVGKEMARIKGRPYMNVEGAIIRDDTIVFKEERYKKSLSEDDIADYEDCLKDRENATSQEEIDEISRKIDGILKKEDIHMIRPDFTKNLKSQPKKKKYRKYENEEQKELHRQKQIAYAQEQKQLNQKLYKRLVSPMDLLKEVVYKHLERSPRTNYIERFTDILAPIPQGAKMDYYRVEKIKEVCIEAKKKMDCKQSEYDMGRISFDEMWEEKKNIQKDIVNDLKGRKVTSLEINKLIRDAYNEYPELNKHGRVIRLKNGKPKMTDARDQNLVKSEAGGWMLQWLYTAHKDEFLKAIKKNKGETSYVRKYEPEKNGNKVTNLKDIGKLIKLENEIVTLDGVQYEIMTRKAE